MSPCNLKTESKTLLKKTGLKPPQAEMPQTTQTQDFELPESLLNVIPDDKEPKSLEPQDELLPVALQTWILTFYKNERGNESRDPSKKIVAS